eukprot:scaffold2991_cov403-Prasinococcus_capsulatus_cf.AAC.3
MASKNARIERQTLATLLAVLWAGITPTSLSQATKRDPGPQRSAALADPREPGEVSVPLQCTPYIDDNGAEGHELSATCQTEWDYASREAIARVRSDSATFWAARSNHGQPLAATPAHNREGDQGRVFFLHLHKCAGGDFCQLIARPNYPTDQFPQSGNCIPNNLHFCDFGNFTLAQQSNVFAHYALNPQLYNRKQLQYQFGLKSVPTAPSNIPLPSYRFVAFEGPLPSKWLFNNGAVWVRGQGPAAIQIAPCACSSRIALLDGCRSGPYANAARAEAEVNSVRSARNASALEQCDRRLDGECFRAMGLAA